MNERIRQLAEQATRNVESTNSYHSMVFDKEKFAELIVQECAVFAMVATDDHFDVDALYKHFGIEQ